MKRSDSPNIRRATAADAEPIARIYEPYVTETVISFETEPPSAEEMRSRLETILPIYPWLVIEENGDVVGYAYAGAHSERAAYRWSADVSVYLRRDRQGRGLGRALYARLLEILAKQGFVNLYAGVTLPNPPSVGIHESFGFRPVGVYEKVGMKFGEWHDVGWWQKQLKDRSVPIDDPIPFATFILESL